MAMEKFLEEFLLKNNKQILSKDEVTSLRKRVTQREEELKNIQGAFEKLTVNYQKQADQVKFLSKMVSTERTKLADNYVSKLKYEELERIVSNQERQLGAAKETISYEKTMKLKMEQEVKELQKTLKCVKDRELSLSKTNQNLMCTSKCLENQLKEAREATMEQVKLNVKIDNEKKELNQQFISEMIGTRREIVALKNEMERLTMNQFKFQVFVRDIVNTSDYQGYRSDDAFTVCGQLDSITSHIKSQFEKWRKDLLENEQRCNRSNGPVTWSVLEQESNLSTEKDTSMSTTSSRSSSTSESSQSSIQSRLPGPSHRQPQQKSFEARSSVTITNPTTTNNRKRNFNNGLRQLQQQIMKSKKHAKYTTNRRRKSDQNQNQWWCTCGTCFKSMKALRNHIKKFSFEWKFKCEKCPQVFRYLTQLKTHLCKDHGISNPFKGLMGCTICGEMLPNRRALQKHIRTVCKLGLGNKSLHFHQPTYRETLLNSTVDCTESDSESSKSVTTGTVVISDSESDEDENENSPLPSTSATSLRKTASTRSEKRDALGRVHRAAVVTDDETGPSTSSSARKNDEDKKKSRHSCRCTCGNQYKNKCSLEKHIRTMTVGYPLECIKCLQKFSSFSFLKKHMAKKHEIFDCNVSVGCSLCGRQLKSIFDYKNHFKREHK